MAKAPFVLTRTIAAPSQAVFAVLCDLHGAKRWMPEILNIRELDDKPVGVGKIWVESRTTPRGPSVSTVRITVCEPGAFALVVDNKKFTCDARFDLATKGKATEVTYTATGGFKGLMKAFNGKFRTELAKMEAPLLDRLAEVVENGPAPKATKAAKGKPVKAAKPTKPAKVPAKKTAKDKK